MKWLSPTPKLLAIAPVWLLLTAFAFSLASPQSPIPSSLKKLAFVGAWANGQPFPLEPPAGRAWVSPEQVERELRFRGWQPPLTTSQLAELASALEADASVDVLASAVREKRRWVTVIVVRVVWAPLKATVHLAQARIGVRSLEDVLSVLPQVAPSLLAQLPQRVSIASVQLQESGRRVHLSASEGEWRKGMSVLFFREASGSFTALGKGRIVAVNRPLGSNRWLLEAEVSNKGIIVRPGDKAIPVFSLPAPFAGWE